VCRIVEAEWCEPGLARNGNGVVDHLAKNGSGVPRLREVPQKIPLWAPRQHHAQNLRYLPDSKPKSGAGELLGH